ncbi:hypothetical protein A7J50_5030 [Pseudomonas antarctica]|uniref:Type I restriction modification DNA specificity domain-containing protein n=1 Tax=Pseudomonas antarctica TaxID=219572 RepID=A0A172Z751_9PSED|nr:restriction endonuclease subunit S [Pseudomonas antarctica]ANF88370.1 hypothetical protein A7J50_5030 [Pseudomonas antarctica]
MTSTYLTRLGDFANEISRRAPSEANLPVYSVTKHQGFVPSLEYFKKQVFSLDTKGYKMVVAGELAYATIHLDEGSIGVCPELSLISPMYTVFRIDETKAEASYLERFLKSPKALSAYPTLSKGSVHRRAAISFARLAELPVPLPPLPEQRRITAILDKADALRAKRREAIVKLDQLLQTVFLEMFGDPVTNPKGWPGNTTLGDIALDMQYGPRFHNEAYSLNGIKIVRITDLSPTGELDFDAMPRMDVEENVQVRFVLQPGDIIFARTGATVGKVALIQASDPPSIAGAYFIRVQVNNSVLPEYVFAALRTKSIQKFIAVKSRQAAQQNFSGPGLRKLPMPVPSLELQCQFASLAKKIEQQKRTLQEHVGQQDALFASLQDRAFNGEL